ncbi:MAG: DNA mismatch endonuclease Vsr [Nitrospinae bacterium]|nr:DNA mismatch endonuclease Vsr [Nitrospinota bacterium]
MTDIVDKQRRSKMMSKIRGRNTVPELVVRRIAHKLGLRFRLHRKDLPGCPDLVFPKYRLVVFVHGCFWHRHEGCQYAYKPKSRIEFWTEKFASNVARDRRNEEALRNLGWRVLVIWECETKNEGSVKQNLTKYINRDDPDLYSETSQQPLNEK